MGKRYAIPFNYNVRGNYQQSQSSKVLDFPFKTVHFRVSFTPGPRRLLQIKFYVTRDSVLPTNAEPHGSSLLNLLSDVDYIVGDGEVIDIDHEMVFQQGQYVVVYANNASGFEQVVDVMATIEDLNE